MQDCLSQDIRKGTKEVIYIICRMKTMRVNPGIPNVIMGYDEAVDLGGE
jgi:hypothetical protein